MDKQIELKAKIGECRLELERLQSEFKRFSELKNNFTQANIAKNIGVSPSTVSREIARNIGDRGYRPNQANEKALERRKTAAKFHSMTDEMQKTVTGCLLKEWSPEQISGYLKAQGDEWVSHETIYQFGLYRNCRGS